MRRVLTLNGCAVVGSIDSSDMFHCRRNQHDFDSYESGRLIGLPRMRIHYTQIQNQYTKFTLQRTENDSRCAIKIAINLRRQHKRKLCDYISIDAMRYVAVPILYRLITRIRNTIIFEDKPDRFFPSFTLMRLIATRRTASNNNHSNKNSFTISNSNCASPTPQPMPNIYLSFSRAILCDPLRRFFRRFFFFAFPSLLSLIQSCFAVSYWSVLTFMISIGLANVLARMAVYIFNIDIVFRLIRSRWFDFSFGCIANAAFATQNKRNKLKAANVATIYYMGERSSSGGRNRKWKKNKK